MSALSSYFSSLATKIRSKTGKSATLTPTEMITEIDAVYQAGAASVPAPVTQTKTAPNQSYSEVLEVVPDEGYYLSKVEIPKALGGDISDFLPKTKTLESGYGTFAFNFPAPGIYLCILPYKMTFANFNKCIPIMTPVQTYDKDGDYVFKATIIKANEAGATFASNSAGLGTYHYMMAKIADL